MKLSVSPRAFGIKGENNKIRREGNIPSIVYGKGRSVQGFFIQGEEFQAILRQLKPSLLATTIFELNDGGKSFKALVKEVQYHPVTYAVLHIDFLTIDEKEQVTVNVPIQITGIGECSGVKLGGFMRQVIRSMKVSCAVADLPQEFVLDVSGLGVAQSMRLSDIAVPARVKPLAKMNEVAVVIAKKA